MREKVNPDVTSSAIELPLSPAVRRERSAPASGLEEEVIALFDELRSRLLRYVLGFHLSSADAEEIIQEAFLALFQHLQQGRSRQNLQGWMFRVVHNLSLKRLAKNGRRVELEANRDSAELCLDPRPNPEEQASSRQRRQRLLAVLDALPEQDQQCLRLRAEGLRYREIAEVLSMSLGGISASLARSLARLSRADGGEL
jgi:RNA polymerase sigma-70 factor (ECF subfamily)